MFGSGTPIGVTTPVGTTFSTGVPIGSLTPVGVSPFMDAGF
jgi:hypothetical protein